MHILDRQKYLGRRYDINWRNGPVIKTVGQVALRKHDFFHIPLSPPSHSSVSRGMDHPLHLLNHFLRAKRCREVRAGGAGEGMRRARNLQRAKLDRLGRAWTSQNIPEQNTGAKHQSWLFLHLCWALWKCTEYVILSQFYLCTDMCFSVYLIGNLHNTSQIWTTQSGWIEEVIMK